MQEAVLWPEEDFQAVAGAGAGALGQPGITKCMVRDNILKEAFSDLLQTYLSCCGAEMLQNI